LKTQNRIMAIIKKPYTLFIIFLILLAFAGPLISPHDAFKTNIHRRLETPSVEFLFGTDELGRCLFSRIIYGARVSLGLGIMIMIISMSIGGLIGIVSGYFGTWIDELFMRITDIFMSVPSFIVAMVLISALGGGVTNMILVFSITSWTRYARITRSLVVNIRNENYVETARLVGLKNSYILMKHILPSIAHSIIVMATLGMGMTILMTSSMSFLGLGITEPTPDWGAMLNNGTTFIRTAPYLAVFPGLIISLTVLSFNFLGEALRRESNC
jgi:peptide/nickel transport system permease protein